MWLRLTVEYFDARGPGISRIYSGKAAEQTTLTTNKGINLVTCTGDVNEPRAWCRSGGVRSGYLNNTDNYEE